MGTIKTDRLSGFAWQCHERNAARRAVEGSKRGFTLMELMVYIAIMGIVVIVAGQAFSNSAKSRIRTQSMLKASEVAENVATLFKTDVAQTGAKSSMETHATSGGEDTFSEVKGSVYMDTTEANRDFSSFRFIPESPAPGENLEEFRIRRVRYSEDGHYEAVDEVTWLLVGDTLKRRCVVVDGANNDDCAPKGTADDALTPFTVEMATGVEKFQVLPAIPRQNADATDGVDEYLVFPDATGEFKFVQRYDALKKIQPLIVPNEGGSSLVLKNFASNFKESDDPSTEIEKNLNEVYAFKNTGTDDNWKNLCEDSPIHLGKDTTYELSFNVYPAPGAENDIKAFIPGKDHMAVGFRNSEGEKFSDLDDFAFYPPAEDGAKDIERKMRFSVNSPINACIAFTFSYYSPAAAAAPIVISNLKLRVSESAFYKFDDDVTYVPTKYKKNVKAFQLKLQIKRNGESGEAVLVIPTPSNGPTD